MVDEGRPQIGFIGAGVVGTALARSLAARGYAVVAIASRRQASAEALAARIAGCQATAVPQEVVEAAQVVFVTTPDDAIGEVVKGLRWSAGKGVVHCSGALGLEVLEAGRRAGAAVGACHPLQSFASLQEALANLPGTTFALEAEGWLLEVLVAMVATLEGRWLRLQAGDRALYHAAAVFISNYTVTLASVAAGLWESFGIPSAQALEALLPLLEGTVRNLRTLGLPRALTGPIARGDVGTVQRHLAGLRARTPHWVGLYRELGRHTIPVALARGGIARHQAHRLGQVLEGEGRAQAKTPLDKRK